MIALQVSRAKAEVVELERRNGELRGEAVRASELGKQLAARLDAAAAADQRKEECWQLQIDKLEQSNTSLNMQLTRVAAGGKQARKEAAEVLVAQVSPLWYVV